MIMGTLFPATKKCKGATQEPSKFLEKVSPGGYHRSLDDNRPLVGTEYDTTTT